MMLILQGVTFKAAKKKKGMSVGFITFEAAEHFKSTAEVFRFVVGGISV